MSKGQKVSIVFKRSFGFFVSLARYYLVLIGVVSCLSLYGLLGLYCYFSFKAPLAPDFLAAEKALEKTTLVYALDGSLIAELGQEKRRWVSLKDVPKEFLDALILTEDRRFYEHGTFDLHGILRALWRNLRQGELIQGGSSITQQVAKNLISNDKTFDRKMREAILARRIFAKYTREEILEWYINQVPLGHGTFGVAAASLFYYNLDITQMGDKDHIPQLALLAGLVNAPTRFSPIHSPQKALIRRNWVLSRMKENGYLSAQEFQHVQSLPLGLSIRDNLSRERVPFFVELVRKKLPLILGPDRAKQGGLIVETSVSPQQSWIAHDSLNYGISSLEKRQGYRGPIIKISMNKKDEFLAKLGLLYGEKLKEDKLYVGLVTDVSSDRALVQIGEFKGILPLANMTWAARYDERDSTNNRTIASVREALSAGDVIWVTLKKQTPRERFSEVGYDEKGEPFWLGTLRPKSLIQNELELAQINKVQGALLSIDVDTGYVHVYEAGADFGLNQFDRITMGCRLPGSTIKPIYYSLAIDRGYSYDTLWSDKKKTEIDENTGREQTLQNIDNSYLKEVTLRNALIWSKNPPSQEIFNTLGAKRVANWAYQLGISTRLNVDKSLALGASCTKIIDMIKIYALFSRMGSPIETIDIKRILDARTRQILYDKTSGYDVGAAASGRLNYFFTRAGLRPQNIISTRTAYLTSNLLQDVFRIGHSGLLRSLHVPMALKTGTSSNTSDVATYATIPSRVVAIQIGTDNYTARQLGYKEASFTLALPTLGRFIYKTKDTLRGVPNFLAPPLGILPNDSGGPLLSGERLPPLQQAKIDAAALAEQNLHQPKK